MVLSRWLRIGWLWCMVATAATASDTLEAFGIRWSIPYTKDWAVDGQGDGQVLRLLVARPALQPRRPAQFALADMQSYQQVTLEAEVKREQGSLILVYAWRDANHFNYAHLSVDPATDQPVHNGIFHVYGGDRVRISPLRGPAALPTKDWVAVRLTYDASTGIVGVTVNGKTFPALEAVDLSLDSGKVGLGSFFETAQFRNVRITGR